MSPEASRILVSEVMPILTVTIPRLRLIGCDDAEELTADAVASAAQMLASAERSGKPLLGSSTAFYVIQGIKSGRRSTSANRTDAMSPATQLDGRARVMSLDDVVGIGDGDSELTIGDTLATEGDDPGTQAARNIDWQGYLDSESNENSSLVCETAAGVTGKEYATRHGVTPARITQRKRLLAMSVKAYMGDTILTDVTKRPVWVSSRLDD